MRKNHRRRISVLIAGLCAIMLVGGAWANEPAPPGGTDAKSIVLNGGFEEWQAAAASDAKSMDCPQSPTGWSMLPGPEHPICSVTRDATIKHAGAFSIRLTNTNTKSHLAIGQRLAAEPEYRYIVRAWFKGDRIDAYHPKGAILHLVASSSGDMKDTGLWAGNLRAADKSPVPHTGTFDWTELVCTCDTPVGAQSIMLLVEVRGAGTLWLDDIQVTRLEKCKQVESY